MKHLLSIVLATCLGLSVLAPAAADPFTVVMYDRKTEKQLGKFPPGRNEYARVMTRLNDAGAKAVVLKFFLDRESGFRNDQVLANAFGFYPVFLQAAIDDAEKNPNLFDTRFFLAMNDDFPNAKAGKNGIIPLRQFSDAAYDLGFVDVRSASSIPMLYRYRGKYVKSLWYSILAFVCPNLKIEKGHLVNGAKRLLLNEFGEVEVTYPKKDNLGFVSFVDIVNNKANLPLFGGKVVIIACDGNNIDRFSIRAGNVKSHRVFVYALQDLYGKLK